MSTKNILATTATVSAIALASVSTAFGDQSVDNTAITTPTTHVKVTRNADGSTTTRTIDKNGVVTTTRTQVTMVQPGAVMAGPGTGYDLIAKVPSSADVALDGCLATHDWCQVNIGGKTGWIQAQDIRVMSDGQAYALADAPSTVQVRTLQYDKKKVRADATAGAVAGAATGAAVAGPVGAAVGGLVGAAGGVLATHPDQKVTTYVTGHPVPTITLQGDVRTGVVIPDGVTLTPVPDSKFAYVYDGGTPIIVNPRNRTVVKILN